MGGRLGSMLEMTRNVDNPVDNMIPIPEAENYDTPHAEQGGTDKQRSFGV